MFLHRRLVHHQAVDRDDRRQRRKQCQQEEIGYASRDQSGAILADLPEGAEEDVFPAACRNLGRAFGIAAAPLLASALQTEIGNSCLLPIRCVPASTIGSKAGCLAEGAAGPHRPFGQGPCRCGSPKPVTGDRLMGRSGLRPWRPNGLERWVASTRQNKVEQVPQPCCAKRTRHPQLTGDGPSNALPGGARGGVFGPMQFLQRGSGRRRGLNRHRGLHYLCAERHRPRR